MSSQQDILDALGRELNKVAPYHPINTASMVRAVMEALVYLVKNTPEVE
jgi:hypothetical protein